MEYFNCDIFTKNDKNKYTKVNEIIMNGIVVLQDMLNYNERKVDGEKIRIVKHYNYNEKMNIDIYFNNGYKYIYHDIPCTSGAYIDSQKLVERGE